MISFWDSLWYCTASVWPIDVILAETNSVWLASFSFGLWLFTFFLFFVLALRERPSVTHKEILIPFFLFSPGAVPMFFFPSLTLSLLLLFSSHPPHPTPLAHPSLHHLSVPIHLQAKAVYLFRQNLFCPLIFLLPHPSIFLSVIVFLSPLAYTLAENQWEGKNGEEESVALEKSGGNPSWITARRSERNFKQEKRRDEKTAGGGEGLLYTSTHLHLLSHTARLLCVTREKTHRFKASLWRQLLCTRQHYLWELGYNKVQH